MRTITISMVVRVLQHRRVGVNLYKFCLRDRSLPWRLRSRVINEYERLFIKRTRREDNV